MGQLKTFFLTGFILCGLNAYALALDERRAMPEHPVAFALNEAPHSDLRRVKRRAAGGARADADARNWLGFYLSDTYRPSPAARFVFIPRVASTDVDVVRMNYEVNGRKVTVSQTSLVFMVQVEMSENSDVHLTPTEIERLGRDIFKDSENLQLIENQDLPFLESSRKDSQGGSKQQINGNAPWLNYLKWWQDKGDVGFYLLKTQGGMDEQVSLSYSLLPNRWFFERPRNDEIKPTEKEDDYKLVLSQLVSIPRNGSYTAERKKFTANTILKLSPEAQPPQDLQPVYVSRGSNNIAKTWQMSYELPIAEVDKVNEWAIVMTVIQNQSIFAVQLERVTTASFVNQIKDPQRYALAPLSLSNVQIIARRVFKGADDLTPIVESIKDHSSLGTATVAMTSLSPWLNKLTWWQDATRIVFYLPKE